jgi:hypothetical protein
MVSRAAKLARIALVVSACLLAGLLLRAEADTWERYQADGARIGALSIEVSDVFDTTKKDENHWLAHAANFLHITTRESIIRRALLFKMGDRVDAATIHETERLLRSLPWVADASIEPVSAGPGSVQAVVKVHDAWSLEVGLKFNHAGGQNEWGIRLHENNLLGFGKQILLAHEQTTERNIDEISYRDPLLFGSRWTLEAGYSSLSDGRGGQFKLIRPFYQLSATWSVGVEANKTSFVETLYQNTDTIYKFPATITDGIAYGRWLYSYENRTALRAGLEFKVLQATYGDLSTYIPGALPPPDLAPRHYQGPMAYWSISQDRYTTGEDVQNIGRTEDLNLGWDAEVHAGYFGKTFGSLQDAWYLEFQLAKGWRPQKDTLVLLKGEGHGFLPSTGGQDVLSIFEGTVYNQSLPWQTLAADLQLSAGYKLFPEHVLYIGGFDGLRGYANHFRTGSTSWVFSAEDRVVTPWSFWGLVQMGFVAYVDAGAIKAPNQPWTKTYADVGAGLRIGNLKSSIGRVIVISVAVPLVKEPGVDNYQIVVGNVLRF